MATEGDYNRLYNSAEFAWSDLTTWSAYTNWRGYDSGLGISTTLVYTLPTVDLGVVKTVVPFASAVADGTIAWTFETSTDNITFTSSTLPLTGRYIKATVTITNTSGPPALVNAEVEYNDSVTQKELFHNLDTSTLSQNTDDSFTIPIQKSYQYITSVTGTASASETRPLLVIINDDTAGAPTFKVINLDTFGKVAIADGVVDIEVHGFPTSTTLANGNIG
jgi:hypothetical protein